MRQTLDNRDKVFHSIMTAAQTGVISCMIAERLCITPYEAFLRFFRSRTYALFRRPFGFYSTLGEAALVNEFLKEDSL